jgi:hypothetical protein
VGYQAELRHNQPGFALLSFAVVRLAIHPCGKPQGILAKPNKPNGSVESSQSIRGRDSRLHLAVLLLIFQTSMLPFLFTSAEFSKQEEVIWSLETDLNNRLIDQEERQYLQQVTDQV